MDIAVYACCWGCARFVSSVTQSWWWEDVQWVFQIPAVAVGWLKTSCLCGHIEQLKVASHAAMHVRASGAHILSHSQLASVNIAVTDCIIYCYGMCIAHCSVITDVCQYALFSQQVLPCVMLSLLLFRSCCESAVCWRSPGWSSVHCCGWTAGWA